MGICQSKPKIDEPKQSIKKMPTEYRLMPKQSRLLDINYKQIPNKFKRLSTNRKVINVAEIDIEIQGLIGLTNLGNTCFLNSSIQALSNSQPLTDYFMSQLHIKEINPDNPLSTKGEIVNSFAHLIRNLWQRVQRNDEDIVLRPKGFINTLGKFNEIFASGTQEDAHEFIAYLLDQIHEDLNRIKKKPYVEVKTLTSWPTAEQAAEAWLGYLSRNQSIIVDLFQGNTLDTLQCLTCKQARYRFEPFMYLSVPVPPHECDLNDCIKEFLKQEVLTGDQGWNCPKCGKQKDSMKKIDLWSMPNLLIIHLKRFKFTATHRSKIRSLVKYPLVNLSFENICCSPQEEKPTYDLYSVINHSGTLTQGHYTAYAKNRDDLQWYYFNDSLVNFVEKPEESVISADGYLLFYFKNSVEEFKRQTLEGIQMSQKRKTIKNTIVIKQTLLNIKSRESLSNISQKQKSKNNIAPSISSNQQVSRPILIRKQTKHFQRVRINSEQESIIVEEN